MIGTPRVRIALVLDGAVAVRVVVSQRVSEGEIRGFEQTREDARGHAPGIVGAAEPAAKRVRASDEKHQLRGEIFPSVDVRDVVRVGRGRERRGAGRAEVVRGGAPHFSSFSRRRRRAVSRARPRDGTLGVVGGGRRRREVGDEREVQSGPQRGETPRAVKIRRRRGVQRLVVVLQRRETAEGTAPRASVADHVVRVAAFPVLARVAAVPVHARRGDEIARRVRQPRLCQRTTPNRPAVHQVVKLVEQRGDEPRGTRHVEPGIEPGRARRVDGDARRRGRVTLVGVRSPT